MQHNTGWASHYTVQCMEQPLQDISGRASYCAVEVPHAWNSPCNTTQVGHQTVEVPVIVPMPLNVLAGKATTIGTCLPWFLPCWAAHVDQFAVACWCLVIASHCQQSENNLAITSCYIDPSLA